MDIRRWLVAAVALTFAVGLSLALSGVSAFAVIETGDKQGNNFANPAAWPTLIALRFAHEMACSGTIVGERVILTAASCLQGDQRGEALVGTSQIDLDCNIHRDFGQNPDADFALCAASAPLPVERFERVRIVPPDSGRPLAVTMLGFGCTQPFGLDRAFGRLTIGEASLTQIEAVSPKALVEGSVLCPGDGGGGTFMSAGGGPESRMLVGVNSSGDAVHTSTVALTGTATFREWAEDWTHGKGITICGLDGTARACKAQNTPPRTTSGRAPASVDGTMLLSISHKPGESVRTIVERSCGPQPEAYYTYMRSLAASGQIALDNVGTGPLQDVTFTHHGVTGIPLCVSKRFSPTASARTATNVPPNDETSTWTFPSSVPTPGITSSAPVTAAYHPIDWKTREDPIGTMPGSSAHDFNAALRKYNKIFDTVGATTPGIFIDKKQTWLTDFSGFDAQMHQPLASLEYEIPPTDTPVSQSKREFRPTLTLSDSESASHCVTDPSANIPDDRYPYDLDAVKKFMTMNEAVRKERSINPAPVNIYIADNGLIETVTKEIVPPNWRLTHPEIFSGLVNDVDGKPSHGIQVTSLAFGGKDFIDAFKTRTDRPRFNLLFGRVYEQIMGGQWQDNQNIINEIVGLASQSQGIVNMSFASLNAIGAPSKTAIEAHRRGSLIVVAAGNAREGAESIQQRYLSPTPGNAQYPALFGGNADGNVVTVAATRADGTLAGFSFWGRNYVDIAAPGCMVPALTVKDFNQVIPEFAYMKVSGTSVAAPLVTFAAALIKWELGDNSLQTNPKRRLMVAADIDNRLANKRQVIDGRRLNIPKAIASLYFDVLELKSSSTLLVGDISFLSRAQADAYRADPSTLPAQTTQLVSCGEPYKMGAGEILKVVPNYSGPDDDSDATETGTLVYYKRGPELFSYPESGKLRRKVCANMLNDLRIGFKAHGVPDAKLEIYKINEVRDIVMREVQKS